MSAGKTEEIKTRRASLPAAWPPLQPAGAWGAGGGRCAAPSPERGRPGARGLQDGPQSRFPASAQVQVVSGDPPRTCWPQAVSAVPAVPRCRAAPGVRRQPPAAEVAPSPHLRPGLRASGARPATPGFPRPETTEGSPEWNRGSPFPTEKETLATPLTRARPGLDPHGPPGLPSRGLESRARCPDPGVRAPAAPAPCQVRVAGVGAWGGAPGVSGNAWGRRRGHRRGQPGARAGAARAPPAPRRAPGRSRDVTQLAVPGAEAREGAGAEPAFYKRSPPGAPSRSPRPRAPGRPRPGPPLALAPPGRLGGEGPSTRRLAGRGTRGGRPRGMRRGRDVGASAQDRGRAEHRGHGHQLDVADAALARGAQRHRVPRGRLRENREWPPRGGRSRGAWCPRAAAPGGPGLPASAPPQPRAGAPRRARGEPEAPAPWAPCAVAVACIIIGSRCR